MDPLHYALAREGRLLMFSALPCAPQVPDRPARRRALGAAVRRLRHRARSPEPPG
jgi:hypothetical protein